MIMGMIRFFLVLFTACFSAAYADQNALAVESDSVTYRIGSHLEYFVAREGVDFDEVWKNANIDWKKSESSSLSFGVQKGERIWFRYRMSGREKGNWVFQLPFPRIETFVYYRPNTSDNYTEYKFGFLENFVSRPFNTPNFAVPLGQLQSQEDVHYFYIENRGRLNVNAVVSSEKRFLEHEQRRLLGIGLYFGIMSAMVLYNLFILLSTRDRRYLYYIAYTTFWALLVGSIEGTNRQYFWPNVDGRWEFVSHHLFGAASVLMLILFSRKLLETTVNVPKLDKFLLLMAAICIGVLVSAIVDPFTLAETMAPVVTIASFVAIFSSTLLCLKKVRAARFFLAAFLSLGIGGVLFALQISGLIESNFVTEFGPMFGSALEVCLLSFALADRIKILNNDLTAKSLSLEKEVEEKRKALEVIENQQQAILEGERLRVMGQFAASVMHELRGPAAGLQVRIQQLSKFASQETLDKPMIQSAVDRMTLLCGRLQKTLVSIMTLVRHDENAVGENCSVRALLDECRLLTEDRAKMAGVKLIVDDVPPQLMLICHPEKVTQVVLNLISNAIDAVEEAKEKWIRVSVHDGDSACEIRVTDSGPGVASEVKAKLFSDYYTTKPRGKGTGMGLKIALGLAEQTDGTLFLDDTQKETCFVFRISRVDGSAVESTFAKSGNAILKIH